MCNLKQTLHGTCVPIPTNSKATDKDIKLEKGPQYHNPDPLVRLTGDTNKTNAIIDGVSCKGLVDKGGSNIHNY